MFFLLQWGPSGKKKGDRLNSKLHFNFAPHRFLKPFFFILYKYSDCASKGYMLENMGFWSEVDASSMALLSVHTQQDHSSFI